MAASAAAAEAVEEVEKSKMAPSPEEEGELLGEEEAAAGPGAPLPPLLALMRASIGRGGLGLVPSVGWWWSARDGEGGGETTASPAGPCVTQACTASRSMGRSASRPVSWLWTSPSELGGRRQRRWCQRRKMEPSRCMKNFPKLWCGVGSWGLDVGETTTGAAAA